MRLHALSAAFVLATIALATTAPARADDGAVMAVVRQFITGYNQNSAKMMVSACAATTAIIDEFPPHRWQSCADWIRDAAASDKSAGVTNSVVTLGTPWHVDVTGDRAYVVAPASYTYRVKGRPASETGSVFTLVLNKGSSGWRITAWAWAKH